MPKQITIDPSRWIIAICLVLIVLMMAGFIPQGNQGNGDDTGQGEDGWGRPDFRGTPRYGERCQDVHDCVNHPPVGYTGNPIELYCVDDGNCYS